MKVFLSLSGLLLKAFFGISRLKLEKTPKGIAKQVGIGFLVLYGIASIGSIFVLMTLSNYDALAPIGLQGMVILNNLVLVSIMTFGLSLILVMSIYFMSGAEIGLQALPLKPWQLFSAKLVVVYVSEVFFSLLVLVPTLVIFGIREQPGLLFYVHGLAGALLVPLIPVCLVFFLVVPVMRAFRRVRNRSALLFVSGFLGIAAMVAFQVYFQSGLTRMTDPEWIIASLGSPDSLVGSIGSLYPPTYLLWKAMSGGAAFQAVGSFLLLAGICAAAVFGTVAILSKAYTESLLGFDERRLRKTADADLYIRARFRRGGLEAGLFRREWVLMNREMTYFLNGPFIIILLPLILVILFFVQRPLFEEQLGGANLLDLIRQYSSQPFMVLIPAAVGAFLGGGTMITATSFSRDAKFLPILKSLPIPASALGRAKLLHGLAFGAAAIVLTTLPLVILLQLGMAGSLLSLGLAASFIWLANILGLYLDTAAPRLRWDTPLAAFKQNPNALAGMLGNMGLLLLVGLAAYGLKLDTFGYVLALLVPAALAALVLTLRYPAFLAARMAKLEP